MSLGGRVLEKGHMAPTKGPEDQKGLPTLRLAADSVAFR